MFNVYYRTNLEPADEFPFTYVTHLETIEDAEDFLVEFYEKYSDELFEAGIFEMKRD